MVLCPLTFVHSVYVKRIKTIFSSEVKTWYIMGTKQFI